MGIIMIPINYFEYTIRNNLFFSKMYPSPVQPNIPTNLIIAPIIPTTSSLVPRIPISPIIPTSSIITTATSISPVIVPNVSVNHVINHKTPIVPKIPVSPVIVPKIPVSPVIVPKIPVSPIIVPKNPIIVPKNPIIVPKIPVSPVIVPKTIKLNVFPKISTIPDSPEISNNGKINFTPNMIDEDGIINYAMTLDKNNFSNLLNFLAEYYYNDTELVSDKVYDELIDIYEAKYGSYDIVGAEPTGEKVDLPHYLGSLRKLKKDKEIKNWVDKYPGPYIIEDKIDGLTLLLVSSTINGNRVNKLYTRGRGYRGTDVSYLLDYIKLPSINKDIAVRGEIVITKDVFSRIGTGFKNARNMASGVINSKKQFNPSYAKELSFFAYRIINNGLNPEQEINMLRSMGFNVPSPVFTNNLTEEILNNYFKQRKQIAPYEIDGLVIYQNVFVEYPDGENPRHVIAFKTDTEKATTVVTDVTWEASKNRLLKPVVHYEAINLSGATLQRATAYNARFIVNNNIGPGAIILVTRSGDTIPRVLSVLKPAPNGPSIPQNRKYSWNENQVEFILLEDDDEVITNKLRHFLETLGIKNTGPVRVRSLVDFGIRNIGDLLSMTSQQISNIPGIGITLSNQIISDIHNKINGVPLARIMDASGIFEKIGERRFEMILDVHPDLLNLSYKDPLEISAIIRNIKGFKALADQIAAKLSYFAEWLKQHPEIIIETPASSINNLSIQLQNLHFAIQPQQLTIQPQQLTIQPQQLTVQPQSRNLTGITVVFSGFRDRDLEDKIRQLGGKVTTSVSKNTTYLIMKDINDIKGKGEKAQELGVNIISKADFQRQFLN